MAGNHNLDDDLVPGLPAHLLALQNGLDPFKAPERVLAIPLRDRLRSCLKRQAMTARNQRSQCLDTGLRQFAQNNVMFAVFGLAWTAGGLDLTRLPEGRRQQTADVVS